MRAKVDLNSSLSGPTQIKMTTVPGAPVNIQMKNLNGKVGSYAISTVDFNSWMNEPIVQVPQRNRKVRGVKEIVHKIFVDCAAITQDPFWVDKFNTAAIGKLPNKFSYHDGVLTYRKGAKSHTIDISNNPHEAARVCMEFFRTHGGIFSPLDEQNSLELQYARAHAVTEQQLTWKDANRKVQECMLSYYVMDMKALMNLSTNEVEQLRQTIRLGIANKYFGKHNIQMEGNRIHSITGLLWNETTRIFYIDPELKPTATRTYTRKKDGPPAIDPSQKDMVPQFGAKWVKYIETLDKKIQRYNRRMRRININHARGTTMQIITSPETTTNVTPHTKITTTDDDREE